jgi:hypothetical protein
MDNPQVTCKVISDNGQPCTYPVVGQADYCWMHGNWFQADLEIYKMVDEHFRQDIREYFQRSNFYLVVEAALLSVFISRSSVQGKGASMMLPLAILGLLLSGVWFLVMRGSLKWIQAWRARRAAISKKLDRYQYHSEVEELVRFHPWESPTTISTYVPILFGIGWVALLVSLYVN